MQLFDKLIHQVLPHVSLDVLLSKQGRHQNQNYKNLVYKSPESVDGYMSWESSSPDSLGLAEIDNLSSDPPLQYSADHQRDSSQRKCNFKQGGQLQFCAFIRPRAYIQQHNYILIPTMYAAPHPPPTKNLIMACSYPHMRQNQNLYNHKSVMVIRKSFMKLTTGYTLIR